MAIDAIVGVVSAIGDAIGAVAPEAAAAGAADVGAGVAAGAGAAETAGAIALPEIAVTAPAIAETAGIGTEAALAGGAAAAGLGAETALAGGGAAALGGLTGAAIAAGGLGGGAPVGTPGAAPSAPGAGAGPALSAGSTPADVLAGSTGPLAALDTTAAETLPGAASLTSGPSPIDITDPFATAPPAVQGQAPGDLSGFGQPGEDIFSLAQTPDLGGGTGVGALTGGTGIPTPQPMDIPATIAPSAEPAAATATAATPAAATPTAGTAAAAGPSFGGVLKTAGELAPLGALGLVLARGQPSLPPAMQQALNNLGPAQNLATTQLTAAAANQITPAQAAQIATYKQNAQNQLYQLYARMGRDPTNDTDYIQGLAKIDSDALAMQQQFIDSMISTGLQAQGVVDSTLQSAANLQVQQDQAFQSSIASAMQSFGLVTAINTIGSSRTPAAA